MANFQGGPEDDVFRGGPGDDDIIGGGGSDRLFGAGGDDFILGGDWSDDEEGGGDPDGGDRIDGGDGDDRLYGGYGADVISGGAGDDYLDGTAPIVWEWSDSNDGAVDVLDGGAGNDQVRVSHGDQARGGAGVDTLVLDFWSLSGRGLDESWALTDGRKVFNDGTRVHGFERLVLLASDGRDRFAGGDRSDTLEGNGGDDLLLGRGGDDILWGGEGADQVIGGAGDDVLRDGGSAQDWFPSGDSAADILRGGAGNDRLISEAGADRLSGGAGDDLLLIRTSQPLTGGGRAWGDAGRDVAQFGHLRIELDLGAQSQNAGAARGWVFSGIETFVGSAQGDLMRGSAGADRFLGDAGADRLIGRGGHDHLIGGRGRDVLTGGDGHDIFSFSRGDGADQVTDFTRGEDRLRIDAASFGFDPEGPVRVFNTDGTLAPRSGPAFVFQSDGEFWVVPEGGGSRADWTLVATLENVERLSAADILLL